MIPAMRRLARIASVALITAGVVLLADAAITLVWKEPLSAIYSAIEQNQAADELDSLSDEFLQDPDVADLAASRAATARRAERLADLYEKRLEEGKPFGRIEIPSIDADYVVVEGTEEADLERGPGHYPDTALPGQRRTVAIAGHRTTYGAPFNQIDKIEIGDTIVLEMPYGTFTYDVTATRIVDPDQVGIVRDVGHDRLVLTSCHPLYSAAQRYAVFADLKRIDLAAP
jgi:sortase A